MRTVLSLLVPFLLLQSLNCRPILRGVDKSLTRKIVNDTETEHQVHPPSSSTVPPLSSLPATVAAVSETPTGAAAAAAAESRITEGEHCKVQFKWVVSRNQRASSDGALGVIMMLDRAGRESDEATTPAFREWVAGETYEDELEFAHCPNTRIQGFRVVFYPYQVPGSGPADEDDPSSLSFSHVEALETSPILRETWEWAEGGAGGGGGKQGPFIVSMEDYTVAWILKE